MTTAESLPLASLIVAAFSLVISVGALIYTAKSVNAARRATQLQIFDGLFRDIKRLDAEYQEDFKSKGIQPTKRWRDEFYNTLEYMAFLLNHELILRKEMDDFYKDAMIHWHDRFTEAANKDDLAKSDYFPEFRRLVYRLSPKPTPLSSTFREIREAYLQAIMRQARHWSLERRPQPKR